MRGLAVGPLDRRGGAIVVRDVAFKFTALLQIVWMNFHYLGAKGGLPQGFAGFSPGRKTWHELAMGRPRRLVDLYRGPSDVYTSGGITIHIAIDECSKGQTSIDYSNEIRNESDL
jgi:hypothetical protein